MTSAISQLVYMPNFRAIGQNGNRQKHRQKHRKTDALEFYKDTSREYPYSRLQKFLKVKKLAFIKKYIFFFFA